MQQLLQKIFFSHTVSSTDLLSIIQTWTDEKTINFAHPSDQILFSMARETSQKHFGFKIYCRALIEFSNYCRNDCFYCGLRRSNSSLQRFRLTEDQILDCCQNGYDHKMRTFVLQSGEDQWYNTEILSSIVHRIKKCFPDCAITLSVGERSSDDYRQFFQSGADRYLLRHETIDPRHYQLLHPPDQSIEHRLTCLNALKSCGYQIGSGFMVASPGQTASSLTADIVFLQQLQPQMIGIGPFIPHSDTPFAYYPAGSTLLTLRLISLLRLLFPDALIPATTALGSLDPSGIEKGILAGANVIMPNFTPVAQKDYYSLYDHKQESLTESAEGLFHLSDNLRKFGYRLTSERGDHPRWSADLRRII